MATYEKFEAKMWKVNNSLVITIPSHITKYCGLKEGDDLKVMAQKITQEEELSLIHI